METTAAHEKLWAMIKKYRFAMLTSQHEKGCLRSRPMTTIDREPDDTLWFFAKSDSDLVEALQTHDQVCLSYGNSEAAEFVCASGPATVVTDIGKKRALWNPAVAAWFPEGAESNTVALIRVMPNHAEYWDSKSNNAVRLFSMAKAMATGNQITNMGEHRAITL